MEKLCYILNKNTNILIESQTETIDIELNYSLNLDKVRYWKTDHQTHFHTINKLLLLLNIFLEYSTWEVNIIFITYFFNSFSQRLILFSVMTKMLVFNLNFCPKVCFKKFYFLKIYGLFKNNGWIHPLVKKLYFISKETLASNFLFHLSIFVVINFFNGNGRTKHVQIHPVFSYFLQFSWPK